MKNRDVENAINDLKELYTTIYAEGWMDKETLDRFGANIAKIETYYNFITGKSTEVVMPWTDPRFVEKWNLWKTFKRQQFRFVFKPIGEQSSLKDLYEMAKGDMDEAIAMIQNAIDKNWQGIYPMKRKSAPAANNSYKNNIAQRLLK